MSIFVSLCQRFFFQKLDIKSLYWLIDLKVTNVSFTFYVIASCTSVAAYTKPVGRLTILYFLWEQFWAAFSKFSYSLYIIAVRHHRFIMLDVSKMVGTSILARLHEMKKSREKNNEQFPPSSFDYLLREIVTWFLYSGFVNEWMERRKGL